MTKCVKWVVVKETLKKMEVIVFVFCKQWNNYMDS